MLYPKRKILQALMEFGKKIYVNWKLYESAILFKDLPRIDNFEDGSLSKYQLSAYVQSFKSEQQGSSQKASSLTINFSTSPKINGYVFGKFLFVGDQDVIIIYDGSSNWMINPNSNKTWQNPHKNTVQIQAKKRKNYFHFILKIAAKCRMQSL